MLFIPWDTTYRGSFLFLVAEFLRSEVMSCRREMCKLMYRVIQVKEKLIARADELTEVSSCKHSWHRATRKAVFMSVYNLCQAAVWHDVWILIKVCPKVYTFYISFGFLVFMASTEDSELDIWRKRSERIFRKLARWYDFQWYCFSWCSNFMI